MKLDRKLILALDEFSKTTIIERFKCDEKCASVMLSALHREKLIHIREYDKGMKPVFKTGFGKDADKPKQCSIVGIRWAKTVEEIDNQLEKLLEDETIRYEAYCYKLRMKARDAKRKLKPSKPEKLDMSIVNQIMRANNDSNSI